MSEPSETEAGPRDAPLRHIEDALRHLRFGVVVQIERTENRRLVRPTSRD